MNPHLRAALLSLWVTTGATLLGAFLPFVGIAGVWLVQHPQDPPAQALLNLAREIWYQEEFGWFLLLGALAGFVISGWMGGIELARQAAAGSRRFLMLVVGGLLGLGFGTIAYLLLWISGNPDASVGAAWVRAGGALSDPADPLRAFLLAGALTGLTVTAYLMGGKHLRRFFQAGTGVVIGGIAGLVIFSFAYVVTFYSAVPDGSQYVIHFAEAIYSFTAPEFAFILLGSFVGYSMSRYSWRLYGIFTLTALLAVVLGFVLYSITVTLPRLGPDRLWFALILFAAEFVSLTMVLLYSFYTLDVATRKRWQRAPRNAFFSSYYLPKVAFHVPTFNEPPELVISTLKGLLAVDYPEDRFVVLVADDSTRPESLEPVKAFCEEHGVAFHHREKRGGFKAGGLNYVLARTPEDVDLIAVIDSDYRIEPEFLRETVGYFIDPQLAWIQTPQDYSNEHQSFLTEQYYVADKYFYRTVLPSRNEENSIIFCGTMGILRKQALVDVGGWGEDYITEDAELSVRLLSSRWNSLYVNKTYGRGLIPATFEGYKKQHYRWAFGGGQVFRGHFWSIFLGRFTRRQRFDYVLGNIHWFEGIFILTIALAILAMALGDLMGFPIITHHAQEIMLIGLIPWFLLVDGFTRLHMVLRKSLSLSFGGTLRVLGMWFAVKFSNSFAAFKGFLGFKMAFLRTPKRPPGQLTAAQAVAHAVRLTRFESVMAVLLGVTGLILGLKSWFESQGPGGLVVTRLLLALWLGYYALMFAAAPLYAYKASTTYKASLGTPTLSSQLRGVAQ